MRIGMRARRARLTWSTSLLLVTLLAFSAPVAARTYLNVGDGSVRYKPHRMGGGSGIACGVWNAKRLHWRHWGNRSARATGTLVYNPGEPTCAAGKRRSARARFRFFRPRANCNIYRTSEAEYIVEPRKLFTRANIFVPSFPAGQRVWKTAPIDGFTCDPPH